MILRLILGPRGTRIGSRQGSTLTMLNLHRSPIVFRVINSRRLRWVGYVARTEEGRRALKMLIGKNTGNGPLGSARSR